MPKATRIILWVLTGLLAALFLFAGSFKLPHADQAGAAVVLTTIHHHFPIAGSNVVILALLLAVAGARFKSAES